MGAVMGNDNRSFWPMRVMLDGGRIKGASKMPGELKINPIHNPKIVPLVPGLELDKLIARQVLGWGERSQAIRKAKKDKGIYDRSLWWDKDGSGPVHLNYFSTDIKAAWDLAEKFKLKVMPYLGEWTAVRGRGHIGDADRNRAPTAPHAICLAALLYASEGNE